MTVLCFILGASFGVFSHSCWLRHTRRQVSWKLSDALTEASCRGGVFLADGTHVTHQEYGDAIGWGNESRVSWRR